MKEYDDLLKRVNTFLKSHGFLKKSTNFIRENENFYDVINFQRSTASTKNNASFTINVGVVNKKILAQKKLKFFNNLMHNQWHARISSLMGIPDSWWVVNQKVDLDGLAKEIAANITQFVFPALQQHNDELYIVKNLLYAITNAKSLIFWDSEQLLTLVNTSFPERVPEILALLRSKIKDSNDGLFIAELMGELNIRQQQF